MRNLLIYIVLAISTIIGICANPIISTKICLAFLKVRKAIKAQGETAPIFALSVWGLKGTGGAMAGPVPALGRMLVGFQPSIMKLLTDEELKFVVAHEVGHCIGELNKSFFGPLMDPSYIGCTVAKQVSREMEVEADLIAGKLNNLPAKTIVDTRISLHNKIMPAAAGVLGLNDLETSLILMEQTMGLEKSLGL